MVILGISAFYHDSAACIVKDGKIIQLEFEAETFIQFECDHTLQLQIPLVLT